MAQNWTPGPWSVVIDDSGDRPVKVPSIQASEEFDCAIVHWDGFWQEYWQSARGNREMNANARLIAAAPDLYEALMAVIDSSPIDDDVLPSVLAALAKARGEA